MKFMSRIYLCLLATLVISGCSGGVWTKNINGEKTYYQDGKELTREQAAEQNSQIAEEMAEEKRQAEYAALIKKAPRRGPSETISVALLPPEIQPGFKIDRAKLNEYWQSTFRKQKQLPMVSNKKIRKALETNLTVGQNSDWARAARARGVPGDVYVQLFVTTSHLNGIHKETRKLVSQKVLLYRAEIASSLVADKIVVEEPVTNIFKNVAHLKTLAQRVRDSIETDMRPRLPSGSWLREHNPNSLKNIIQAFTEQLQNQQQSQNQ